MLISIHLTKGGIKINEIEYWKGVIIAEGLDDPTILNDFKVYKVKITEYGVPIDLSLIHI